MEISEKVLQKYFLPLLYQPKEENKKSETGGL